MTWRERMERALGHVRLVEIEPQSNVIRFPARLRPVPNQEKSA